MKEQDMWNIIRGSDAYKKEWLAKNPELTADMVRELWEKGDVHVKIALARNPAIERAPDVVKEMAEYSVHEGEYLEDELRGKLAENYAISKFPDIMRKFSHDTPFVRGGLAVNPGIFKYPDIVNTLLHDEIEDIRDNLLYNPDICSHNDVIIALFDDKNPDVSDHAMYVLAGEYIPLGLEKEELEKIAMEDGIHPGRFMNFFDRHEDMLREFYREKVQRSFQELSDAMRAYLLVGGIIDENADVEDIGSVFRDNVKLEDVIVKEYPDGVVVLDIPKAWLHVKGRVYLDTDDAKFSVDKIVVGETEVLFPEDFVESVLQPILFSKLNFLENEEGDVEDYEVEV